MKNKKLKLYVWNGVLTDWTDGIAFALASSPEEAVNELKKAGLGDDYYFSGIKLQGVEPEVYDTACGHWIYGGG
jgi:hypothetical protein